MAFAGNSAPALGGISSAGRAIANSLTKIGAPSPFNSTAWNTLPDAVEGPQEAVLLEYEINGAQEKPAWLFLVNPKSLQFKDGATYSTIAPYGARVPRQHFNASMGATLTIPDLLMWVYCYGKSVRSLIEGIQELCKAKPDEQKFSPPLLLFRMGARRFGPCVLQDISWEETGWLTGEPAQVQISITLLEIPKPLTDAEKEEQDRQRRDQAAASRETQNQPRTALTDRQRQEARNYAKQYLTTQQSSWSDAVQSVIPANRYRLSTDATTGDVTMVGSDGTKIGVVGRYDGRTFRVGGNFTTVPTLSGANLTLSTLGRTEEGLD